MTYFLLSEFKWCRMSEQALNSAVDSALSQLSREQEFFGPAFTHSEFDITSSEVRADWDEKEFKGKKIAFRMESGWDVGTFKKHYKGKSKSYKGASQIYFNRALQKRLLC